MGICTVHLTESGRGVARQGRGDWGKLEHFGVWRFSFANPRTALWEFLQIYACLFAVMILARFRAHPFYIWRNQKSLLLIKTYFTALFCSPHHHQMEMQMRTKTKGKT